MQELRFQVEIRFTAILDFVSHYRGIISPYLKQANFNIQANTPFEEVCVLALKDEPNIRIDVRWDRLIYVVLTEGGYKVNLDSKSPIIYFLEIFRKFAELPSFGQVTDLIIASWTLKSDDDFKDSEFVSQWLNRTPEIKGFNLSDVAVVHESQNIGGDVFRLKFGPFKAKDITAFGLSFFPREQDEKRKGLLVDAQYISRQTDVTLSSIVKLRGDIKEAVSQNFK